MKKRILVSFLVISLLILSIVLLLLGCKSKKTKVEGTTGNTTDVVDVDNNIDVTTPSENEATPEDTQETTTEEPTTEPPTTEPPTEPYVGPWTLLTQEPTNPTQSGYPELDNLINNLFAKVITDDMNNYDKVWACYLYLVDNITYSRGMDASTGNWSTSDPATTPVEVLWATDLLNSGQGCCYNYSSTFVYIMRALGYDAHLVTGNVPAYGGGTTPHCWMYVNLAGQQYTFDPDLDMNYFKRGDCDTKDWWFCRPISDVSYFYKAETYHTN